MQIKFWRYDLKLAHTWRISSGGNMGGTNFFAVAIIQLTAEDGTIGLGESAPSSRYAEDVTGGLSFFATVDARQLSFDNIEASMRYVEQLAPGQFAAKSAINVALLDGAARKAGKPLHDFLGLGFKENHHVTSFSIGLDKPDVIRSKVLAAESYPVLKLKVGAAEDQANLAALREAAPKKWVRVDANEAWKTREQALQMIEWLAGDGHIQFIEQPMPASTPAKDLAWLKSRSPLPIFADESYLNSRDAALCAECYHGVNVKLCKVGGISHGCEALQAARRAGLKTMVGCMIETSILISAAVHLAELADYLDVDGNILTTNDPYLGVTAEQGMLSFAHAPESSGLRVRARI
ncbi:MAG: L-Ala-D/L-amino acid epimerase [Pedosphaera sp.]|nr:L-Ala-D/L-amino acid epimerase [Pedosphaera sp.]